MGIFIFKNIYLGLKENLTNESTIVLIGDSIFNNSLFVPFGNSVADQIKLIHGNNVVLCAKDGATIDTCYHQLNVSNIKNDEDYHLFISIGGNDILNNDKVEVDKLFEKYVKLVDSIKNKYSKTKIYLLNLYFPTNEKYKKYEKTIIEWNKLISSLSSKYNILRLDDLLTDSKDFTYEIEPSIIGGDKIAKAITG